MIRLVGKRRKGAFESQMDEAVKGEEFVQTMMKKEAGE